MDKLLCCYVETSLKPVEKNLLKSAVGFEVPLVCIGKGEVWEGFFTKLQLYREYLIKNRDNYKFVLGVDSRDVLFFNDTQSILDIYIEKYYSRGHKMVFNAETNCFPNKTLAKKHANQDAKYKYLNSGCFIGELDYVIEVLDKCFEYKKKKKVIHKDDDQEILQHIFIDQVKDKDLSIWLDYDCEIFQVLWDENTGRNANFDIVYTSNHIQNINKTTWPSIFHYPGPNGHGSEILKILNSTFPV